MRKTLIVLFLFLSFLPEITPLWAQGRNNEIDVVEDTKVDLLIIVGSALAGAVLGLSTLSFSGRPREDLNHIVTGTAVGIVIGVGVAGWRRATSGQELYKSYALRPPDRMTTSQRLAWHRQCHSELIMTTSLGLNYRFSF